MKRIYVNEKWCLGCHLCEYECAYANSGIADMVRALKGKAIHPRVQVDEAATFTLPSTAATAPTPCAFRAASRARSRRGRTASCASTNKKCVGCLTCVLVCPYGAVLPSPEGHAAMKCQLCTDNRMGEPNCVKHCPNGAIVFEERSAL